MNAARDRGPSLLSIGVQAACVLILAAEARGGPRPRFATAIDRARQKLYVAEAKAKAVRVFRLDPLRESKSLPLVVQPQDVVLDIDCRAERLLLHSPSDTSLQVIDPDKRVVLRKGNVRRAGVVRLDPSRGKVVHCSEEGVYLFSHQFERVGEMPSQGGLMSRVTPDGSAAIVSPDVGRALIDVVNVGALMRVTSLRVPGDPRRLLPHVCLNGKWIVLMFQSDLGVDLAVVGRDDYRAHKLALPALLLAPPMIEGDLLFLLATDGNQSVVWRVDLRHHKASRIPAGNAEAFASDAERAALYVVGPAGQVRRLSTESGRPIQVHAISLPLREIMR